MVYNSRYPGRNIRFDIRDDICLAVGGFKHNEIVQDSNHQKAIVVGTQVIIRYWAVPKTKMHDQN